jgi:hypothetical protein
MRACDAGTNPVVGTATYILVRPVALRAPSAAFGALALAFEFFPYFSSFPETPPPRIFPG